MSRRLICKYCGDVQYLVSYDTPLDRCPMCGDDEVVNTSNELAYDWASANGVQSYTTTKAPTTSHDVATAINTFAEKLQKYFGENPNWDEIISQKRVGGEDHNPKWECTFSYGGFTHSWSGYAKKKEVKKIATAEWLDKYSNQAFSTLPEAEAKKPSISKMAQSVPFKEKINSLKGNGVITRFLEKDEMYKVHAAYVDFIKGEFSPEEISEKYDI